MKSPIKDTTDTWIDEDCTDGLHEWCMGDWCECTCHKDTTGKLIDFEPAAELQINTTQAA